jgi:hypothetical protein
MVMKAKALALAALLAAGLAWLGAEEKKVKEKPAAALPADLARLPPHDALFVSLRPADLWTSELGKGFRKRLGKDLTQVTNEFERLLGLSPDQIERLSLVLGGSEGRQPHLLAVRTLEPYKRDRVLNAFAPGATEEKYKGKVIHVGVREQAMLLLDARTILAGTLEDVKATLDKRKEKSDGLSPAIRAAADKKYVAVLGVNPAPLLKQLDGKLPPQWEPFEALFKAKSGVVTLALGEKVRAEVRVQFASAKEAKAGEKAGQAAVKVGLKLLAGFTRQMGREKDTAELVKILRHIEKSLEGSPLKLSGTELTGALELKAARGTLDAVTMQAVKHLRRMAARNRSANNLKQIGLAMHNYHDNVGRFPAAAVFDKDGKALLSWRVLILPYIEQDALYREFHLDEAWDSKHNKKLLKKIPPVYVHPLGKAKAGETYYQAFVGKGAFFEGKRGLRIMDIIDGTSNTLLAVEAAKAVPWSKPEDLPYDAKKPLPKVGGVFPEGFWGLFCDGSVRFLPRSLKPKTLRALITRNGGETLPADY